MLNVALTGNAASGKSSVAELFEQWGATLIDADALVAEEQQPGTKTFAAIVARFGDSILQPDGSLDRGALRQTVLEDPNSLAALNSIVHPVVQERREQLLTEAAVRGDKIVVSEIPLLFEVLGPDSFDMIVLVDAPLELRRKRLKDRGLAETDTDRLLTAQIPPEKKRDLCDIVIDNDGTREKLYQAAQQAWMLITQRVGD